MLDIYRIENVLVYHSKYFNLETPAIDIASKSLINEDG